MRFFGAESIYDMSRTGLPRFEGSAAIRAFLEDWYGAYQQAEDELHEIVDLGHGIVLAAVRERARPLGSPEHAEVNATYALVAEWRDEVAVRVTAYLDIVEARAAARRLAEERA